MGIFFNTSGLITRGFGEANKILTRGFGNNDKVIGTPTKVNKIKEYIFDLISPVKKEAYEEINIFIPVHITIIKNIDLKSSIRKEVVEYLGLKTRINSKRLFQIIDAI